MSNGVRHGVGAVVGLMLTPVIGALMLFGMYHLGYQAGMPGSSSWTLGAVVMVVAAVLAGVLAGTRISPLASLIPGVLFVLANLPMLIDRSGTGKFLDRTFPNNIAVPFAIACNLTLFLALGTLLIVASVPASRWRPSFQHPAGPAAQHIPPGGRPAPYPTPGQAPAGAPVPPSYEPGPASYGAQPRPAPGQEAVPGVIGGGQGPAGQPQPPAGSPQPPQPPAGDEDEPGEWTRMYGGRSGPPNDRPQS